MATEESWFGIAEISDHLRVTRDTVYRWVDSKGLPAHRVGWLPRFRLSEVDEWVREENYEGNSETLRTCTNTFGK